MEGRVMRRSVTLADQLAAVGPQTAVGPAPAGSCNLRDLLKLRDEDDLAAGRRAAAVTLASAMAAERQASLPTPTPSTSAAAAAAAAARTLLDIIRDDHHHPPPASDAGDAAGDTLVRRAVSLPAPTTTSASPSPSPSPSGVAPAEANHSPGPAPLPLPPPRPASQPPTVAEEDGEQGERVSLMALLEQTDRQWSAVAEAPPLDEEDSAEALVEDDNETEPAAAGKAGGGVAGCCCVCMARAKGAAFIPCGHTFCRACARELLAGRGRCPLCNAAIVDVLDIF